MAAWPISHSFRMFSLDSLSADRYWNEKNKQTASARLGESVLIRVKRAWALLTIRLGGVAARSESGGERARAPPSHGCIISTRLLCGDHTHSLPPAVNTRARAAAVHGGGGTEAEFPAGLAHAQLHGFRKTASHVENPTGYSTRDGTEIDMKTRPTFTGEDSLRLL